MPSSLGTTKIDKDLVLIDLDGCTKQAYKVMSDITCLILLIRVITYVNA